MALLTDDIRKKYFKILGLGAYNKANIKKLQVKYMARKSDVDGNYGNDTDNLLRHLYNCHKYLNKDNFKPEEFKCECNGRYCCGYPTYMKPAQLTNLQTIRNHYKKPMVITSGMRCKGYNNAIGGSIANSKHLLGQATDFYMKGVTDTLANRKAFIDYAKNLPNTSYIYGNGINIYGNPIIATYMGNAIHYDSNNGNPSPTPDTGKLVVDGIGGTSTVKAMQKFFGTEQDGVITGQNKSLQVCYPSLQSVQFGSGGSACIRKLQAWCDVATVNGILNKTTTTAWQKKLRTLGYLASSEAIDGIFGVKSMKAWQECLNNNGKSKSSPTPSPTPTKNIKVVDISEFQDTINWTKAKADGIEGAIVRCGFRGYESGTLKTDSMFLNHIKGAYKAGLPVGIYMFTEAINAKEGREEADYAIKLWQTAGVPISFPIAVDTEASGGNKDRCKNLTKAQRTEAIKGFCEQIKKHGYTPLIYASTSWLNNKLDMSKLPYDVWVAQYNDVCEYKGKYIIWQYTSSGRVDGIKGNVDLNHCYIEPKKVNPPSTEKESYKGKYPTQNEIKVASNNGIRDNICAWCKEIANSGEYKYKVFTDDPKTQQCPICHNLTGKNKAWNCIGYSYASWRHGGGIPCKCNCGVVYDGKAEQILKAKTDAEALALAQKAIGIKDIKVIRNGGGTLAPSKLSAGDIIMYYDGQTYFHTLDYVGSSKVSDCGRGNTPNIKYGKKYEQKYCKVAIQYTGGNNYLQFGDRGGAVKKVQEYLNWYFDEISIKVDGRFNKRTLKYVKRLQKQLGLEINGLVGKKTIQAMKKVKK